MRNRITGLALLALYILIVYALIHAPTTVCEPVRVDTIQEG
jgi:hypothetical protein